MPGPTSSTGKAFPAGNDTPGWVEKSSASTIDLAIPWSVRKCWPKAFFARTSMVKNLIPEAKITQIAVKCLFLHFTTKKI